MVVVAAAVHAPEGVAAVELVALEVELELAGAIAGVGVAVGVPAAAIPQHDRTAAVLALRDGALELPYSSGWSSTCTASRLSAGSRLGPRGTAQLFSTPSSSSRRS